MGKGHLAGTGVLMVAVRRDDRLRESFYKWHFDSEAGTLASAPWISACDHVHPYSL